MENILRASSRIKVVYSEDEHDTHSHYFIKKEIRTRRYPLAENISEEGKVNLIL